MLRSESGFVVAEEAGRERDKYERRYVRRYERRRRRRRRKKRNIIWWMIIWSVEILLCNKQRPETCAFYCVYKVEFLYSHTKSHERELNHIKHVEWLIQSVHLYDLCEEERNNKMLFTNFSIRWINRIVNINKRRRHKMQSAKCATYSSVRLCWLPSLNTCIKRWHFHPPDPMTDRQSERESTRNTKKEIGLHLERATSILVIHSLCELFYFILHFLR